MLTPGRSILDREVFTYHTLENVAAAVILCTLVLQIKISSGCQMSRVQSQLLEIETNKKLLCRKGSRSLLSWPEATTTSFLGA